MMITHREPLDARVTVPTPDALRIASETAIAAVRAVIGDRSVSLRWEAIARMVGGARTAKEWRPGWPLPADCREVVAVAFGWTTGRLS